MKKHIPSKLQIFDDEHISKFTLTIISLRVCFKNIRLLTDFGCDVLEPVILGLGNSLLDHDSNKLNSLNAHLDFAELSGIAEFKLRQVVSGLLTDRGGQALLDVSRVSAKDCNAIGLFYLRVCRFIKSLILFEK